MSCTEEASGDVRLLEGEVAPSKRLGMAESMQHSAKGELPDQLGRFIDQRGLRL